MNASVFRLHDGALLCALALHLCLSGCVSGEKTPAPPSPAPPSPARTQSPAPVQEVRPDLVVPMDIGAHGWRVRNNSAKLEKTVSAVGGTEEAALVVTVTDAKKKGEIFAAPVCDLTRYNTMEFTFSQKNAEIVFSVIGENWKGGWSTDVSKLLNGPSEYQFFQMSGCGPKDFARMYPVPVPEEGKEYRLSANLGAARVLLPTRKTMQILFRVSPRDKAKPAVFTLSGVRFRFVPSKYQALTDEFYQYVETYKPDYSDSSKCLLPPEDHRFDTPFPVVKNGLPAAALVWNPGDGIVAETAIGDFNKHVKLVTGAELPVVACGADGKYTVPEGLGAILLGPSFVPPERAETMKKLAGRDGFTVFRSPAGIHIAGAMPKGTMNGMFRMLENNTDLIWARPDETLGTVFSPSANLSFVWGDDVVDIPDSPARGWNGFYDLIWMAHNSCNLAHGGGGGDITYMIPRKRAWGTLFVRGNSGHNIFRYIAGAPPKHPDYYAHDPQGNWTGGQPCFTSKKCLALFTKNALEEAAKVQEHKADYLYIALQDTWKSCLCADCRAPIKLADGTLLEKSDPAFVSTRFFLFLNEVAKAVTAKYPDLKIMTLAYLQTITPPKCEVHPAIVPEFAPYPRFTDREPIFCPSNERMMDCLEQWSKKVPRLESYNYHGLGLQFPRPLADVCQFDFRVMNRFLLGMSSEYPDRNDSASGRTGKRGSVWDYSAMEFWVLTRLYWNPRRNVEQLRKYYIRRTFREAAPQMEKFYGLLREKWLKAPGWSTIGADLRNSSSAFCKGPDEAVLRGYLTEAEKNAVHPKSLELVKRVRARFEEGLAPAPAKSVK